MTVSLIMLPQDVLLTLLQQAAITPNELCSLERSCTALRKLIDNNTWQHVFLQLRRCNTLREPDSWKQEYARRESWSRGWRSLSCGIQPLANNTPLRICGQASAPQKLRRFARSAV